MPLIINAIAQCDYCDKKIEDEILLRNWHPTWGTLAKLIGEQGWKMELSKNEKDWDIICKKCQYDIANN